MLTIDSLYVSIEGKNILNDFSLKIAPGQVHALMGPNGTGKSTLAKVLAGDPQYEVKGGDIDFLGEDLLDKDAQERSHAGLFVGFQYPMEIPGVTTFDFLYQAYNAKRKAQGKKKCEEKVFRTLIRKEAELLKMPESFLDRDLNVGFSGGEKKRNEILQMRILEPRLALLDETDSGLDIDAIRIVSEGINSFLAADRSVILITHYQRLLDYIRPDYVHIMSEGKIIESGSFELAKKLEKEGYTC